MMNKYTFIFEIAWRDPETGRLKPYEYRKKSQMSINGALMAGSVQSCEIIAWPDLGCEAVRKLVVKDFPLTVLLDTHGGDLYRSGPAAYLASREHNA